MSRTFAIGQNVYVYESWSGNIIKAKVKGSRDPDTDIYNIDFIEIVNRAGQTVDTFGGTSCREAKDIWNTAEEAFAELDRRSERITECYIKSIKTVEDLILFPLQHCICGGEYEDFEAEMAYKIRAKELLGIDVDELCRKPF